MQDIHAVGVGVGVGGGGRFFGGGDRRLRQHHHGHHQNYQPVKCPRCDSINTKFCYYNNYNLSQPRHFCKSCRRYWTKGGVLRNVPVGGGCRKTKRSKQKISSEATTATKDNSHSSSESSSLTATTTTTAATEAVSAPCPGLASKLFVAKASASFEAGSLIENQTLDCGIFSEIGNFRSMSTSTNGPMTFGFGNLPDVGSFPASQFNFDDNPFPPQKLDEEMRMHKTGMSSELHDLTAQVDLSSSSQNRSNNIGFGALDWHPSGDQGMLDLPGVVDQAYWSQHQWTADRDNRGLFLP